MAQTEDTELTDLVMEALEKNGSLAKIRALLRANVFLAFEDECENMRHNMSLDNVLKTPEGIYALSIVHEFLEFCNLKNTLFVYKSETRQGKEYKYDGKKFLFNKFNLNKLEINKEPILVTLIKNTLNQNYHKNIDVTQTLKNHSNESGDDAYKDEQNSSYIVHEDSQSSTTNTSQSDNSTDEKNKLHLRLQLDNSDTDTSSDSSRDKSASEYIPSAHMEVLGTHTPKDLEPKLSTDCSDQKQESDLPSYLSKVIGNSSSESTSYVELKPFSSMDEKMINTSGLPSTDAIENQEQNVSANQSNHSKTLSIKNESQKVEVVKRSSQESMKSDETIDYSLDFSASHSSKKNYSDNKSQYSTKDIVNDGNKNSPMVSPDQNSQSSVSISDVADLISDKSSSFENQNDKSPENHSKLSSLSSRAKSSRVLNILNSDNSGDYSESPIPSLSNLSLDIHSD